MHARMVQPAQGDLARALHVLGELGEAAASDDFARRGVEVLPRLVPAEIATLSLCQLEDGRRRVVTWPEGAIGDADRAAFDRHFYHHPLVRYHGSRRQAGPRRISDCLAPGQFWRSALYDEYYRRVGVDCVVALPLHVDRRLLVSFVLNRSGRDFGEREMDLLALLQPQLAALYRLATLQHAVRATGASLSELSESGAAAVIVIDGRGRVRRFSQRAAAQAMRYFDGARLMIGAPLPPEAEAWLRRQLADPPVGWLPACSPLVVKRCDRALILNLVQIPGANECYVLMSERLLADGPRPAPRLTPREREVLAWVAAGKTNREIGAILEASPRTVQKHLERIFVKLGVENRTAAALKARALAGDAG